MSPEKRIEGTELQEAEIQSAPKPVNFVGTRRSLLTTGAAMAAGVMGVLGFVIGRNSVDVSELSIEEENRIFGSIKNEYSKLDQYIAVFLQKYSAVDFAAISFEELERIEKEMINDLKGDISRRIFDAKNLGERLIAPYKDRYPRLDQRLIDLHKEYAANFLTAITMLLQRCNESLTARFAPFVTEINDGNFENLVGNKKGLALIMLSAEWCPACKEAAVKLGKMGFLESKKTGDKRILTGRITLEKSRDGGETPNPELLARFSDRVEAFPTFIILKDGKPLSSSFDGVPESFDVLYGLVQTATAAEQIKEELERILREEEGKDGLDNSGGPIKI